LKNNIGKLENYKIRRIKSSEEKNY